MKFQGDPAIIQDENGNYDIKFENGQTEMTQDFSNLVLMLVFGRKWWGNRIARTNSEKMQSKFPDFIARATVTDQTLSQGTDFIREALQPLISDGIAKTVEVIGEIFSVNGMGWQVQITRSDNEDSKYNIIWDEGVVTSGIA